MFIAANCELRSHFILITEQKPHQSFDTLALNLSVPSYSFDPLNLQVPLRTFSDQKQICCDAFVCVRI